MRRSMLVLYGTLMLTLSVKAEPNPQIKAARANVKGQEEESYSMHHGHHLKRRACKVHDIFKLINAQAAKEGAPKIYDYSKASIGGWCVGVQLSNLLPPLGDAGAIVVADAIKHNAASIKPGNGVTWIKMHKNAITVKGAAALASALDAHVGITGLHLDQNPLGDAGAVVIATSLASHDGLVWLSLKDADITDIGVKALAKALKDNTELTMLNLGDNEITDDAAESIAHAALVNPNTLLTDMDLGYHHFCVPDLTKSKEQLKAEHLNEHGEIEHNCNKENVKQSKKTRKVLDDAMAKARKNYAARNPTDGGGKLKPVRTEL